MFSGRNHAFTLYLGKIFANRKTNRKKLIAFETLQTQSNQTNKQSKQPCRPNKNAAEENPSTLPKPSSPNWIQPR